MMKTRLAIIASIIGLIGLASLAQDNPAPEQNLPPSLTYTNGTSVRVAISDEVYRQLRTVYKLSGATNQFSHWLTNAVRIELSIEAATYLRSEVQSIARQVMQMGSGPNDERDLVRIRDAAKP